jgi:hypothetical protein
VIIIWEDSRVSHGKPDIYGQRISATGETLWEADGAPLVTALDINEQLAIQANPAVVSDRAGGAIFTWEDNRNLQTDIFAQRVDPSGVAQWQVDGVPISTACFPSGICANAKHHPQVASDGSGGGIFTWYEVRDGLNLSVWAQRVNAEGIPQWPENGVAVVTGDFHADFPKIISDEAGGAIIAWQDGRDGFHIYAQRLNNNGVPQWTLNGIGVSPPIAQRGLQGHFLMSDGSSGAIIVWVDGRTGDPNDSDLYGQSLNADGQIRWEANGVPICVRQGHQYSPTATVDGAGGAIVTWEDQGASPPGSGRQWIFAQRVSAGGTPLWAINGLAVYTYHGFGPRIVSDGFGGAIIIWDGMRVIDDTPVGPSIFAQRVNGRGQVLWESNGFEIYHQPGGNYGFGPQATSDEAAGAIIHWIDYRFSESSLDIFAQRAAGEPEITSILMLLLD